MSERDPLLIPQNRESLDNPPHSRTWSTRITDECMPTAVALAVVGIGAGLGYGVGSEIMSGVSLDSIPTIIKSSSVGLGLGGSIAAGLILVGVALEERNA